MMKIVKLLDFFLIPGSDMCNHVTYTFLVSIDRKFAGDYDYVG